MDVDRHRVFPAEAVHGVVEVKSRLTKSEVRDALDKVASVKRLRKAFYLPVADIRRGLPIPPTRGFVFAYTAAAKLTTLTTHVIEWCEAHHEGLWPDAIYVLDRGSVLWFVPDRSRFQPAWRPGSTIGLLEALNPRDVLILMLLQMRSVFTEAAAAMPPVDVKPYVESAVLGVPKFPEPRFPAAPDPPSPAYIK